MATLKSRDETEFKTTKLDDGADFSERIYKTDNDGVVIEKTYTNERDLESGAKQRVFTHFKEY